MEPSLILSLCLSRSACISFTHTHTDTHTLIMKRTSWILSPVLLFSPHLLSYSGHQTLLFLCPILKEHSLIPRAQTHLIVSSAHVCAFERQKGTKDVREGGEKERERMRAVRVETQPYLHDCHPTLFLCSHHADCLHANPNIPPLKSNGCSALCKSTVYTCMMVLWMREKC